MLKFTITCFCGKMPKNLYILTFTIFLYYPISFIDTSMIIEGKILQIMETWPLQLIIETKDKDKIYVTLLEDTSIIHNNNNNNNKVDLNELMPNLYVRI